MENVIIVEVRKTEDGKAVELQPINGNVVGIANDCYCKSLSPVRATLSEQDGKTVCYCEPIPVTRMIVTFESTSYLTGNDHDGYSQESKTRKIIYWKGKDAFFDCNIKEAIEKLSEIKGTSSESWGSYAPYGRSTKGSSCTRYYLIKEKKEREVLRLIKLLNPDKLYWTKSVLAPGYQSKS